MRVSGKDANDHSMSASGWRRLRGARAHAQWHPSLYVRAQWRRGGGPGAGMLATKSIPPLPVLHPPTRDL